MAVSVDFCGETYRVDDPARDFTIGRDADLVVDENRFLHRRFLRIYNEHGLWWLANVGSRLSATVSDEEGVVHAWLAPGARLPLVFPKAAVWFTAGPTTYEVDIEVDDATFQVGSALPPEPEAVGSTTYGETTLTPDQRLLLVSLAEPLLARRGRGAVNLPSSAAAAARLGWPLTKFNRKLDNVCQKFGRLGVQGLHGGPDRLATDRRARLVEYAMSARLIGLEDLQLLDKG